MTRPYNLLVTGSSDLDPDLVGFASAIGKYIIENTNLVLLTGGLIRRPDSNRGSTDYAVAMAAKKACTTKKEDIKKRILTILPDPKNDDCRKNRFRCGEIVKVEYANSKARRFSMVLSSDAIIAICGGKFGTPEIIDLAWLAGKPLLLVPFTGGASEDRWRDYKKKIKKMFDLKSSEIKKLSTKPKTDSETEEVARLCVEIVQRRLRPQCFVAMPFSNHPLPGTYEEICSVAEEFGFLPFRVNTKAIRGSIVEAIWNNIRKSDVVIADVTGYNANVFYELGIAHALGKPTILIIHDKRGRVPSNVPFDIKLHRLDAYGSLDTLNGYLVSQFEDICSKRP